MPLPSEMPLPLSLLSTALDFAPDGILVERGNSIVWINDSYRRLLGYEKAELVGRETTAIIASEDQARLTGFAQLRSSDHGAPQRYRFHGQCSDETVVWLEAGVSSMRAGDDLFIVTIVRDLQPPAARAGSDPFGSLSKRERDITLRTIAGQRPKEIAFALGISEKTVATHRCRTFRKLGLRHDLDLFRFAAERGLLPDTTGQLSADRRPSGRVPDSS
jgi:PAS domain S-box-containing protein